MNLQNKQEALEITKDEVFQRITVLKVDNVGSFVEGELHSF
jgi:hypothetical protein